MDEKIYISLFRWIYDAIVEEEDEFFRGFIDLDIGFTSPRCVDGVCGIDDVTVIIEVVGEVEAG